MGNGTGQTTPRVKWTELRRVTTNRTSRPTDDAVRRAISKITLERGTKANADAVILAALQLAEKDIPALIAEVGKIESGLYDAPHAPAEPGDPGCPDPGE